MIFLAYPNNQSPDADEHAGFRVDWKAIKKDEDEIRRAGYNPDSDHIFETYVGLFVTYADLENRLNPGIPGALNLGFGPVGLEAPAQLLIKTVRDVVVVHKSR